MMQSTEAGLCGPKLQSAPDVVAQSDSEHILYCPECAARLKLVGMPLRGSSQGTSPAVASRQTLADFPPVAPCVAVEASAIPTESTVAADPATFDTVDVTVDDDEPTRIMNATELIADARREHESVCAAASVEVEIPTFDASRSPSAPVEAFDAQAAPIAIAEASGATDATVIIRTVPADSEPASRAMMSDAPLAKEVTIVSTRSPSSRYRRFGFFAAAAFVALTVGFVLSQKSEPASTPAVAAVEHLSSVKDKSALQAQTVPPSANQAANPENAAAIPAPVSALPTAVRRGNEVPRSNVKTRPEKPTETGTALRAVDTQAKPVVAEPKTDADSAESDEVEPSEPKEAAFDAEAAAAALDDAATRASTCRQASDPSGVAVVTLTFAPSGRVTTATIAGPPFVGTETGSCIASKMRSAKVPAFSGPLKTVKKTVTIQ